MITTTDIDSTAEMPTAILEVPDYCTDAEIDRLREAWAARQGEWPEVVRQSRGQKLQQIASALVYGGTLGLLVCIVGAIIFLAQVKDPVVGVPDTTLPPGATIPEGIGLVGVPLTSGGVAPTAQREGSTTTDATTTTVATAAVPAAETAPAATEPVTSTTAPAATTTTAAAPTTDTEPEPATTTTTAGETTTTDCGPAPAEDFARSMWVRSTMPQHEGTCTWLLVEDPSTRPTVG